ncbi:putative DNA-binding protein [Actinoplanes missouriensis 431]|uniref:Putative DNA-binding protein n=1 Tax=Actinoplanes missouriensis (strain ATCC 14538 / DSM 43046 / CBS 188.64 / JCM 3121 / NBRC 102363 / NCIMB 12654 / NRRL B-3342 / UNCC 431) TaxID=512565 RepID=I0GXL1_ACTM4|nr:hypothetical protein ADL19_23245 [Streptomyces purpurogeneiscleroticus]BAL85498.1 putative DNA-binding protein [Actinoplanes missouriensis 431]
MHVRTIEWPEQEAFLQQLDAVKQRHKIRHDSALAELAGISHTAVSNWRNRKARPSLTAITRIAEAIEESPQPLLAAAGLIEDQDDSIDPLAGMPDSIRRMVALYRAGDETLRTRLEMGALVLTEFADDHVRLSSTQKRSS